MAYDAAQAERVRRHLAGTRGLTEKEMFGGIAFLVGGKMAVGIHGAELMVRVPPEETEALLARPGARAWDLSAQPMRGWLVVGTAGFRSDAALRDWVRVALEFVASLTAKAPGKAAPEAQGKAKGRAKAKDRAKAKPRKARGARAKAPARRGR